MPLFFSPLGSLYNLTVEVVSLVLIMGVFMPEVKPIVDNLLLLEQGQILGRPYYRGLIGNNEVVVTSGFIGKVEAALVTQKFIDRFNPKRLFLVSGCGALDPSIEIGTVIAGTEFQEYDLVLPLSSGAISLKRTELSALGKLCMDFKDIKMGKLISGDQILADSTKRDELREKHNAICLDMDSTPVAKVATENNLPYIVLKVVMDHCDENAEGDFNKNFEKFANVPGKMLVNLLKTHLVYMK